MKDSSLSLFLDMDGVLVDFENGYKKFAQSINPHNLSSDEERKKSIRRKYSAAGTEWWANLDWIKGGKELYQAATFLFENVNILSSTGSSESDRYNMVKEGKLLWLKKNIPSMPESNIFIVNGRAFKKDYANNMSILVDDMQPTIKDWNDAGGYGILHDSRHYQKTIEDLEIVATPTQLSEIIKRLKLCNRK